MLLESFYPVLLAEDVTASARFYTELMGFAKVFESDWYVSLKHRENPAYELAIISHEHETIPEGFRRPTSALLLNFEVPSVESEYERLQAAGVKRYSNSLRTCPPDSATSSAGLQGASWSMSSKRYRLPPSSPSSISRRGAWTPAYKLPRISLLGTWANKVWS